MLPNQDHPTFPGDRDQQNGAWVAHHFPPALAPVREPNPVDFESNDPSLEDGRAVDLLLTQVVVLHARNGSSARLAQPFVPVKRVEEADRRRSLPRAGGQYDDRPACIPDG